MMMMHVALADVAGAQSLAKRLEGVAGTLVSLPPGRAEVAVELEPERDRALARVVDAVCTWLEGDRRRSAFVRLGERSHALSGSAPPGGALP
jgi:hypothetical protein